AAPLDFLSRHDVTDFEITHVLADFDNLARKLVPKNIWEARQAGVQNIAILARLIHMHVRAANTYRPHLNDDLIIFGLRVSRLSYSNMGILPHLRPRLNAVCRAFAFVEFVIWFRG